MKRAIKRALYFYCLQALSAIESAGSGFIVLKPYRALLKKTFLAGRRIDRSGVMHHKWLYIFKKIFLTK